MESDLRFSALRPLARATKSCWGQSFPGKVFLHRNSHRQQKVAELVNKKAPPIRGWDNSIIVAAVVVSLSGRHPRVVAQSAFIIQPPS